MSARRFRLLPPIALVALAFLTYSACATRQPGPSNPSAAPSRSPDWVNRGTGAFNDGQRAFYGVGLSAGVRNPALSRASAEARARTEIANALNTYITALMRDYQASVGDVARSQEEQMVEQTIRQFTQMDLSGVRIINHWQDPESTTLFALARLDFEQASQVFERMNQLTDRAREYIRGNAERAFDNLEQARQERQPR